MGAFVKLCLDFDAGIILARHDHEQLGPRARADLQPDTVQFGRISAHHHAMAARFAGSERDLPPLVERRHAERFDGVEIGITPGLVLDGGQLAHAAITSS